MLLRDELCRESALYDGCVYTISTKEIGVEVACPKLDSSISARMERMLDKRQEINFTKGKRSKNGLQVDRELRDEPHE